MTLDEQIEEKEEELRKLKLEKLRLKSLPEEQLLAELLHEKQCHWNHTDQCGWYYNDWGNPGFARKEYLKKAEKMLEVGDLDTIVKTIKLL